MSYIPYELSREEYHIARAKLDKMRQQGIDVTDVKWDGDGVTSLNDLVNEYEQMHPEDVIADAQVA